MNRRDVLLGRFASPLPEGRPLPRVIAWLDDSVRELSESLNAAPRRPTALPLLRPPGAVDEEDFLAACTRCADCITACPHGALTPLPMRFTNAAGTPVIDPGSAPCLMCDGLPCASACQTGALDADQGGRIGVAHIQALDCLNTLGTSCSVCSERCPVPGALIATARVPQIQADLCTGCGICHHVCPAPMNAIAILPAQNRPPRTTERGSRP